MFRWMQMVKNAYPTQVQETTRRTKARRRRRTVKPQLEELTQRILPSASPLPVVSIASPPPVPSMAAITSFVTSMMELRSQFIATIEQDLSNALYTVGQVIAQEVSAIEQQVDRALGINPNPAHQFPSPQPDSGSGRGNTSGSGSGSGTTATQITYNPQRNNSPSENGSTATSSRAIRSGQGSIKMQPMGSGGGGGGSGGGGGGTGSGTGSGGGPHSGSATVTGQIWQDNNGDGSIDNNEMDYGSGVTVDLLVSKDKGSSWSLGSYTTTSNATQGDNYTLQYGFPLPAEYSWIFKIQVAIPAGFEATKTGGASDLVDDQADSYEFSLPPGGVVIINGGLASMTVNTTDDDPNGPLPADQKLVTLRDAMQTGNNGGGILGLTQVNFTGNGASGTITLGAELPDIEQSYDIDGTGAAALAVNANAKGPVYTIDAGKTSTIKGETITDGSGANGGGILNKGNLTLKTDIIKGNTATGGGGGLFNSVGRVTISGGTVQNNQAVAGGGIYVQSGVVTLKGGVTVSNNKSSQLAGGIMVRGGTVNMSGGSIAYNNAQGGSGGGIVIAAGSLTLTKVNTFGNTAKSGGGGLFIGGGTVKVNGGTIGGNKASTEGGGIYVLTGTLTLGANIYNNNATDGGGMYIDGGTVTVGGGTISLNIAGPLGNGGGIYNNAGSLTLRLGVYIGPYNSANKGGGMYLASGSSTRINSCTVSGNKASTGAGVYESNDPWVNIAIGGLTDNDDPGGVPVQGP